MNKIVWLKITSFVGISPGAVHIYGELFRDGNFDGVDLTRTLTVAAARKLNKWYRQQSGGAGSGFTYRAGGTTTGFENEEEVVALAITTYKDHLPGAEVLIKGHQAFADPQPVLDGPPDVMELGNRLANEAEALDYWALRKNHGRMDQLCAEWDKLMHTLREDE